MNSCSGLQLHPAARCQTSRHYATMEIILISRIIKRQTLRADGQMLLLLSKWQAVGSTPQPQFIAITTMRHRAHCIG